MRTRFIKLFTCIGLISVFVLQGIWLYNTYTLLETEYIVKLDNLFFESIEKEVYIRLEDPIRRAPEGSMVEGAHPNKSREENLIAFNHYLESFDFPLDFVRLDSIFSARLNEDVGSISYSLRLCDSEGEIIKESKHGNLHDIQSAYYKRSQSISKDNSKIIQAIVASPYKLVFEQMFLLLLASGIITIVIGYCIFWQIKIIMRQDRISEIRQDFTHAMIHDMKNPITTILMGTQALKSGKLEDKPDLKEQYFDILVKEGTQLLSLTNRILTIAKFEENKLKLSKQDINLPEMINNIIHTYKIENLKEIFFQTDFGGIEYVYADPEYLYEAIRNIVENAIKYSKESVNIDIKCELEAEYIKIRIKDNGFGISLKDQKKIFEKFERASSARKDKQVYGFGLGLNYVYQVIAAHEGDVKVDSIVGSYSEFIISLPYRV